MRERVRDYGICIRVATPNENGRLFCYGLRDKVRGKQRVEERATETKKQREREREREEAKSKRVHSEGLRRGLVELLS